MAHRGGDAGARPAYRTGASIEVRLSEWDVDPAGMAERPTAVIGEAAITGVVEGVVGV
jgi:hypothetical protein